MEKIGADEETRLTPLILLHEYTYGLNAACVYIWSFKSDNEIFFYFYCDDDYRLAAKHSPIGIIILRESTALYTPAFNNRSMRAREIE